MASMKSGVSIILLLTLVAEAELMGGATAATYFVGDASGWSIPNGGAAFYTNWSSQYSFAVGDVFVFNFTTGFHDVARVTRAAFDACSSNNALALQTVGPASITLNSTGEDYFICTFGQHCSFGQKLAINVTAAPASPAPAPAPPTPGNVPPPSPSPSQIPAPSPSQTPSPSPSPSQIPPPESSPSPSPNGGATPPPSLAPGSSPSPPRDFPPFLTQSPPPPPPPGSAATMKTLASPFFVLASVIIGLMI